MSIAPGVLDRRVASGGSDGLESGKALPTAFFEECEQLFRGGDVSAAAASRRATT